MPRYKASIRLDFLVELEQHPQWDILHAGAARLISDQLGEWLRSQPRAPRVKVGLGEDTVAANFLQITVTDGHIERVGPEVVGTNEGPQWRLVCQD